MNRYFCRFFGIYSVSSVALSKCLSSLVFAYRYKMINKPLNAKRAYVLTVTVIPWIVVGLISTIYFRVAIDKHPCNYYQLNNRSSNTSISLIHTFTLSTFIITTVLQIIILIEIIKPLYLHYVNMGRATISNNRIKKLLCRVILCTLSFCVSDFALIVYGFLKHKRNEGYLLLTLNLIINAVSLMCSYADFKKRLFPFQKWKNSNHHQIRSLNPTKENIRSFTRNNTNLFKKYEGIRKERYLSQDIDDKGFSKITNLKTSNIKPVLHGTKLFELPKIKNQIISTNFIIEHTGVVENRPSCSKEVAKPINFVNEKQLYNNRRQFLAFVPRRKNLREFETTV